MKVKIIIPFFFLMFVSSCKYYYEETEVPTTSTGIYSVSGSLISSDVSVSNADVLLKGSNNIQYSTKTDNNGNFKMASVSGGSYTLTSTQVLPDSSVSSNAITLNVVKDTVLQRLLLPKPVLIKELTNSGSFNVKISWSKFTSSGFYEYKVYRKEDSGLDETTGTLVHVSTNISDTTFIDTTIEDNTKYYYRVYVMNEYGKLGGSAVGNLKTSKANHVVNGSFELFNVDNTPASFSYNSNLPKTYAVVSNQTGCPDGNYCLSIDIPVYHYALGFPDLYQLVNRIKAGTRYTLSFWAKVVDFSTNATCQIQCVNDASYSQNKVVKVESTNGNVWTQYSTTFTSTSTSLTLGILNCVSIPYSSQPYKILIDKIVVEKAD